jgi:hypothetical protein
VTLADGSWRTPTRLAVIAYAESLDRKLTRLAKFDNHFNKAQMPGERASALLNWRKTVVKLKANELVWIHNMLPYLKTSHPIVFATSSLSKQWDVSQKMVRDAKDIPVVAKVIDKKTRNPAAKKSAMTTKKDSAVKSQVQSDIASTARTNATVDPPVSSVPPTSTALVIQETPTVAAATVKNTKVKITKKPAPKRTSTKRASRKMNIFRRLLTFL